jgi:hypothetical protein
LRRRSGKSLRQPRHRTSAPKRCRDARHRSIRMPPTLEVLRSRPADVEAARARKDRIEVNEEEDLISSRLENDQRDGRRPRGPHRPSSAAVIVHGPGMGAALPSARPRTQPDAEFRPAQHETRPESPCAPLRSRPPAARMTCPTVIDDGSEAIRRPYQRQCPAARPAMMKGERRCRAHGREDLAGRRNKHRQRAGVAPSRRIRAPGAPRTATVVTPSDRRARRSGPRPAHVHDRAPCEG